MDKYVLKSFQLKAKNRFEEVLDFFKYEEKIGELAVNPSDVDVVRAANGLGKSFRIHIDAPTGSGKTVLIGHIAKDFFQNFVHIVFSPGAGNLEEQTANRLAEIVGVNNVVKVDETTFAQPAVVGVTYVGNWEQFVSKNKATGDYKNRVVREGDTRNFFDWVSEIGTAHIPVVVTIDEAHHGAKTATGAINSFLVDVQKVLGYSPLFVEVSATPILKENSQEIKIFLEDVQKEGLIRKNVLLNSAELIDRVNDMTVEQRASNMIEPYLVDYAVELQQKIDGQYVVEDAHEIVDGKKVFYHSLIGLQVPNGPIGNDTIVRVESYLRDKHGITRDNGKLVVFLSNDKTDGLDTIASPSSVAKVLIYKQGVATGWDCPRAQILLGFRHITSKIFTKQNLGRFVRTTQQKYYDNDVLDYTYVLSNVGDLGQTSFGDDVNPDFSYERPVVFHKNLDGHYSLSSFNEVKIPINHYRSLDQRVIKPVDLRAKFFNTANKKKLWEKLDYTNSNELSTATLISGHASFGSLEDGKGFVSDGNSLTLANDNGKQYEDFKKQIFEAITSNNRTYGNNAQVTERLVNVVVRWYVDTIKPAKRKDGIALPHDGKLSDIKNILEKEIVEGRRFGTIDSTDWNDFAIEQLMLDKEHWVALNEVIQETLNQVESIRNVPDDDFNKNGAPVNEREFSDDGVFCIDVTEQMWVKKVNENRVGVDGIGEPDLYATRLYETEGETEAYRDGVKLSKPEENFEKRFVPSVSSVIGNKTLSCYYKSPENKKGSLRFGVKTLTKVTNFYPDYLGEIKVENFGITNYEPFVIEIKEEVALTPKDENFVLNLCKAQKLLDLYEETGVKAGLAYERNVDDVNSEWVYVNSVNFENNTYTVANLKDYILS